MDAEWELVKDFLLKMILRDHDGGADWDPTGAQSRDRSQTAVSWIVAIRWPVR